MLCVIAGNTNDFKLLLYQLHAKEIEIFGSSHIYKGCLHNEQILLVDTGYCKVNMGLSLGYILSHYPITLFIGVGNCGDIGYPNAPLGSIALSSASLQYDVNFVPLCYKLFQVPNLKPTIFPNNKSLIYAAQKTCEKLNLQSSIGLIGTADQFIASSTDAHYLKQNYNIDFVDNESGVIGQIAYLYHLPALCIKGISNYANNSAATMYNLNNQLANRNACLVTYALISKLIIS